MKKIILTLTVIATLFSCHNKPILKNEKIFNNLKNTGISFSNNLAENDSLNYMTYTYMYMGGGIASGDINNDGLNDLFFTGNMVSNKLYLNKGDLKFTDITEKATIGGDKRWYTGVTMADVNGDGFLDIYCSVGGKFGSKKNQLFINNGDETFSEKGLEYGLDDAGNSIQATFFDYDNDGDLDLYVGNYPITPTKAPNFYYAYEMKNTKDIDSDHLYRNDGDKFTNVTAESGIKNFGLTLSATVGDLNNDGWSDIYVSNDFSSPDYMFINNQDGTFKEVVKSATGHTAFYGMGADISDFNNDGYLDLFQVDMDANTNRRQKANMGSMNPTLFWSTVNSGFHYQYMHNTLQLNSGVIEDGIPHFSNVSRLSGISSTDWSWGPLFADLDNDGLKDIIISNGTRREINNTDYFNNIDNEEKKEMTLLELTLDIPSEKVDNFVFKNNGNLDFKRANKQWGINYDGFSNGIVYSDLDNDGDLEIVINNIDDNASIFENTSSQFNNSITVQFEGTKGNKFGLGNRVYVKTEGKTQMQELTLTRGFQSSVAPELHFGLNRSNKIEELKVQWTDGKTETLTNVSANQKLILKHSNATSKNEPVEKGNSQLFLTEKSNLFPTHKHTENTNDDFATQVLLPHKMSQFGPALAIGDLNNDGLDDYFIGGAANNTGSVFFQTENGFEKQEFEALNEDIKSEDVGALIFDPDQDGDNDLYIISGGYEFDPNSKHLQDRLYINNGNGKFTKALEGALPPMITSGSKVYTADFDKDGKKDLLVLGRQIPGNYPKPATSYILKNNSKSGKIQFDDITESLTQDFKNLGMATSAIITDINNDSWLDIIAVGEWMPIRVFKNNKTAFKDVTEELGLGGTTGWWWSIKEGDFDNDGDMDYIVGNNGLNYKYKATEDETFDIFVNDFDKNSKDDIVLSYYNEGEQYPVRGRSCSSQQIPSIKKKFKNYNTFSEATLIDVYTEKELNNSLHYQVKSFASVYLENTENKFIIHKLPVEAQVSSINQILVNDYDADGVLDVIIAGNLHMSEVETPRNDAGYGQLLKGNSNGTFKAIPAHKSGLFTPGDVKDMGTIKVKDTTYILTAKNNDYVQFTKIIDRND